jgi:pyruvate/2-oxoglutarate dehydrogenase complex dihydrolipoamide acyltransferase (E2) component
MSVERELGTAWRKTAATIYKKPVDSRIVGSVEIDITDLEVYLQAQRQKGIKLTLTHFFVLATARAIASSIPELRTYIRRGEVVAHPTIDAMVSVLLPSGEMGSVLVKKADQLSPAELVAFFQTEIQRSRSGSESKTMQLKDRMAAIPWPFRGWAFGLIRLLLIDWGLSFPRWGLSANNFGSFVVSNIGSLGLDMGFPALFPVANVSFVLIIGGTRRKPWVVDEAIVPRTILQLGAALDHRVVDASHGARLFRILKKYCQQPELIEQSNTASNPFVSP